MITNVPHHSNSVFFSYLSLCHSDYLIPPQVLISQTKQGGIGQYLDGKLSEEQQVPQEAMVIQTITLLPVR